MARCFGTTHFLFCRFVLITPVALMEGTFSFAWSAFLSFGVGAWISLYGAEALRMPLDTAALLSSIYWLGLTFGRLLSVPLALHFRPSTLIIADVTASAIVSTFMLVFAKSPSVIWTGSAMIGVAFASAFPSILTEAQTRLEALGANLGSATSIVMLAASIGEIVPPTMLGAAMERAPSALLWFILGCVLTWAVFSAALLNRSLARVKAPAVGAVQL